MCYKNLLITIFGLGFSPIHKWLDTSEIDWEYEKSNVDFDNDNDLFKWAGELKKKVLNKLKLGFHYFVVKQQKKVQKQFKINDLGRFWRTYLGGPISAKSVPMQRGARFQFFRSVPMQRRAHFLWERESLGEP